MKKLFSVILLVTMNALHLLAQCNGGVPLAGSVNNISPTSVSIFVGCSSCPANVTVYLEYGPAGFTPGTTASPGPGGTVKVYNTSFTTDTLTGLAPGTQYDYYARALCNGAFSANTTVASFATSPDCATAPVLSCGTLQSYTLLPAQGAWNTCNSTAYSQEKVYAFTPSITGMHSLFSSVTNGFVFFSWKAASAGCNANGWMCMGNTSTLNTTQFSFGPLTAGTTYYILADANTFSQSINGSFRVECPFCNGPTASSVASTTPSSASVVWSGNATILEYGPQGFIPGTGAVAGPGGTIKFVSGGSYNINNLNAATNYDVYLRNQCSGSNYSPNSNRISAITKLCPPSASNPLTVNVTTPLFSTVAGYYSSYSGCSNTTPGEETIYLFTPPSSGSYSVRIYHDPSTVYNFLFRQAASGCNPSTFSCMSPDSASGNYDYYTIGPLTGGTGYELFFDFSLFNPFPFSPGNVLITCPNPQPSSVAGINIQSTAATISWSCNCPATTYLEYGPAGFTPGTGTTPGTGGTLVSNVSPPHTITGLTAETAYDVYLRSACGTNINGNTPKYTFRTTVDCNVAPVLNCNDYFQYCLTPADGNGTWSIAGCSNSGYAGREKIWKFTPGSSGAYALLAYSLTSNNTGYLYNVNVYIKNQIFSCNTQNWICAGSLSSTSTAFQPTTISLGNLQAGTTYFILIDGYPPAASANYCYKFIMSCPGSCFSPQLTAANNISSNSATIYAACNTCYGNTILEYGPHGFTPGTGTSSGTGGTVVNVSSYPYTLTGIAGMYDVYARRDCGGGLYSTNSNKLSFMTLCGVTPTTIALSTGTNSICPGSTITLIRQGGSPGQGGTFKWYTGSCGGTLAGTGDSLTVSPYSNKTYYLRAESSCGNTACITKSIMVLPVPTASISAGGRTTFCNGGNVILYANTGSGLTYQWKKNNTSINGATGPSFIATTNGNYKVTVTNIFGCSKISNTINVTVNPLPAAVITAGGPTTFCAGDSVMLTANSGTGLSYQWRKNGNAISGATNISFAAKEAKNYTCLVTNSNSCKKTSNTITTTIPCREGVLAEEPEAKFDVYPNPAKDRIFIHPITRTENYSVQLTDETGRTILYNLESRGDEILFPETLNPGSYFITILQSNHREVHRVVIIP